LELEDKLYLIKEVSALELAAIKFRRKTNGGFGRRSERLLTEELVLLEEELQGRKESREIRRGRGIHLSLDLNLLDLLA
jgi:hypothetical protein